MQYMIDKMRYNIGNIVVTSTVCRIFCSRLMCSKLERIEFELENVYFSYVFNEYSWYLEVLMSNLN